MFHSSASLRGIPADNGYIQMFSDPGHAEHLLKSDKWSEQSRVISSALPSLARTPLISHADNSWIVLSAGIGVCKARVLRRGPP